MADIAPPYLSFLVIICIYKYNPYGNIIKMDEKRICKLCGQYFKVKIRRGWICDKCGVERAKIYSKTRLKDMEYYDNPAMRDDIDMAIHVLKTLGYDVEGDVHAQFMGRCARRGFTF
jgi:hypothetical protein